MENVTKALLIATGALLFILLFSLISYLFTQMGGDVSDIYADLTESDVTEYNQVLLNYDGRDDLTIQDVVSIINYAIDNNEIHGYVVDTEITLKIDINGTNVTETIDSSDNETYIDTISLLEEKLQSNTQYVYSCTVNYATNSKLVGSITITESEVTTTS